MSGLSRWKALTGRDQFRCLSSSFDESEERKKKGGKCLHVKNEGWIYMFILCSEKGSRNSEAVSGWEFLLW